MKTINIKDIKNHVHATDYIDNDILVGSNLGDIIVDNESVRVNFCLIVFCTEGGLQATVNNETYTLGKDDMLTCVPSTIIGEVLLYNAKVKIFGLSVNLLEFLSAGEPEIVNIIQYVRANPLWHLHSTSLDASMLSTYEKIIMMNAASTTKWFRTRIMKSIFVAFFSELMAEAMLHIGNQHEECDEAKGMHIVFKNFMKLLANDDGTHRMVNYYADKMCYSAKYLSYVVKATSGRTPLSWINDHAIEIIKHHLRYSDKSVKEIADMLEFPNSSFFGKYVKHHLGMTPVEYRKLPNG